ncbi:MAG: FHA domain-containing protein [Sandaracinaceae bacterium]|nr:FHA domain-containing protein [Sandaracinaceae bacterium]
MAIRLVVRGPSGTDAIADIVFEFDQQRVVIGRGTGADVRLPRSTVSEHHATIRLDANGFVLVDESSTNGTFIDGVRLVPGRPKILRDTDTIRISSFFLSFQKTAMPLGEAPSVERTAALARRIVRELLDPAGYAQQPAELLVIDGPNQGDKLVLPPAPARLIVGRSETADLMLTDADASREHLEIIRDFEGTLIRDLESKNGMFINDKPMRERRLRDRDEVVIGATLMAYADPADAAVRSLEGQPDVVAEATEAMLVPAGTAKVELPEVAPAPEPEPAQHLARKSATPKRKSLSSDAFIYIFAGVVLLASIIALFVLLRAR